jgi:DNA-binding NarL/FixJ family response regulator
MPVKVLIVDDHELILEALAKVIDRAGGFVVVGKARDGAEAVEYTRRVYPDVVIMDIKMGDIDGIETTRRIRAIVPQAKVVALSGYSDRNLVRVWIAHGAVARAAPSACGLVSGDVVRA